MSRKEFWPSRTTSRHDPPQRVLPLNNGTPFSLKIGAPPHRAMFITILNELMPFATDRVYGHDPPQRVDAPPQRVFPFIHSHKSKDKGTRWVGSYSLCGWGTCWVGSLMALVEWGHWGHSLSGVILAWSLGALDEWGHTHSIIEGFVEWGHTDSVIEALVGWGH